MEGSIIEADASKRAQAPAVINQTLMPILSAKRPDSASPSGRASMAAELLRESTLPK